MLANKALCVRLPVGDVHECVRIERGAPDQRRCAGFRGPNAIAIATEHGRSRSKVDAARVRCEAIGHEPHQPGRNILESRGNKKVSGWFGNRVELPVQFLPEIKDSDRSALAVDSLGTRRSLESWCG